MRNEIIVQGTLLLINQGNTATWLNINQILINQV